MTPEERAQAWADLDALTPRQRQQAAFLVRNLLEQHAWRFAIAADGELHSTVGRQPRETIPEMCLSWVDYFLPEMLALVAADRVEH